MGRVQVVVVAGAILMLLFAAANRTSEVMAEESNGVAAESANTDKNVLYQDWMDSNRSRKVPVKIYLPKTGTAPYPVVIFSHGLGGSREAAVYLGEHWSEHGYLCVFVQHAGSDTEVWQSVAKQGRQAMFENMQSAANGQNLIQRAYDIKFVLNELERLNKSDNALKGQMDLSRIALAGHSFGAGTTLAIAGQNFLKTNNRLSLKDKRVKSVIYLCPPASKDGTPVEVYGNIDVPGMLLTGTEDNSPIRGTVAEDRRIPFDGIRAPHQFLINFIGADHAVFGGRGFRLPLKTDAKYQTMIAELTTRFLDATLKGDNESWKWLDSKEVTAYLGETARLERK